MRRMNSNQPTIQTHQRPGTRRFIACHSHTGEDKISCMGMVTGNDQCLRTALFELGDNMLNECNTLFTRKRQQRFIFTHSATAASSENNAASLSGAMLNHFVYYLEEAALRLAFFDLLPFGIYFSRFLYSR